LNCSIWLVAGDVMKMTTAAARAETRRRVLKCNTVELSAQRFDRLSAARAWHDDVNAL
jgi:hypothetical protein